MKYNILQEFWRLVLKNYGKDSKYPRIGPKYELSLCEKEIYLEYLKKLNGQPLDLKELQQYTDDIRDTRYADALAVLSTEERAKDVKPRIAEPFMVVPAVRCYDCATPVGFYTTLWKTEMNYNIRCMVYAQTLFYCT